MSGAWLEVITFSGKPVCIRLDQILEVVDSAKVSTFPSKDPRVIGITSYLGEMLTVLDLDTFINETESENSKNSLDTIPNKNVVLIFKKDGLELGMAAKSVSKVEATDSSPSPTFSLCELKKIA